MSTIEVPVLEDGVWIVGPDGELIPDYDATFPTINEGEVVHGTVVRVDKDEVLVDIGYKSEGVIPVSELSIRRSVNPADEVSLGEEIDALVMTKEDAEGRLILSKKRARFELAWKAIEAAAESGEAVNGRVIEVVKGGLILDLGVRGFLPASLVDIRRVQDLDEFTGKELRCKVIELNRSRNNVVLSRRAVLEDERKEMRQAILDRLNPGDVVDGQISNLVDFGAFVDLDGMDGLIHISELSWSHVNHPSEVLEIGQTVKVKVLDIDRERQRISLGLKQTQSDPWQQVLEHYHEEDVVEGRVTKVVTFGAFVEILPGVEGLVHISELAQHHVENPREVVSQGDPVNVLILEIDGDRRRLSLSLKRVEEGAEPLPRADGGESVHLTPNLRLSEEAFPAAADELAETALALDADVEESAAEAGVTEEIAIEPAEEAVVADEVAVEPLEEAVIAETVVEELAEAELDAEAAGDGEAAVGLAEEALAVDDEVAVEPAEEAVVATEVSAELADQPVVADALAVELAEEAVVDEAVVEELAEETVSVASDENTTA
jgi:small subunit ribosomal protein S1